MVFMYFALSCWNFAPYLCGQGSVLISIRERGKVPEPGVLHVLGEQTGMKLSCIKPTSKVRGLSIEPRSSTGCID